jgi:cyclic lactone autoinducer peptide
MVKNRMLTLTSLMIAAVATLVAASTASVFWLNEPEVPQELQK